MVLVGMIQIDVGTLGADDSEGLTDRRHLGIAYSLREDPSSLLSVLVEIIKRLEVVEAFRLVYNELFLGLDKTLITGMVMDKFGFKTREEVLGLIEKIEGDYDNIVGLPVAKVVREINKLK